jgi:hypothetical protein
MQGRRRRRSTTTTERRTPSTTRSIATRMANERTSLRPGASDATDATGGRTIASAFGIVDATANPAMSCPYPPYLEPSNLDPSTWMHAMGGNGAASAAATNRYDATRYSYSLSAAAALTTAAAIAVHPLSIVGVAAAVTTAATMWAVGYHRDGASSSTNDGGDGSGGYIYKIWSGGEEVFGKNLERERERERRRRTGNGGRVGGGGRRRRR